MQLPAWTCSSTSLKKYRLLFLSSLNQQFAILLRALKQSGHS
jgi:hypothetical protein